MATVRIEEGEVTVLLLHWGRTGGGPRHLKQVAQACRQWGQEQYAVSYHAEAEIASDVARFGLPALPVSTYTTAAQVLTHTPRWARNVAALRTFIGRHDVDVVVSTMGQIWQSLSVRGYLPRHVKYLAGVHDVHPHPGDERVVRALCDRVERGRADGLLAYSHGAAEQLAAGRTPVFETALGIDTIAGVEPRTLPDGPLVLGFFGRIVEYKGLDLLLEAADALSAGGRPLRVEIHGDGDPGDLPSRASAASVQWHLGWVPEDRVESVVRRFDLLVLPYRDASQSGVLTVAQALGVPVVATPVGSLPEQVADGGLVAERVDAAALAQAIEHLATPERYAAASRAAIARGFGSWQRVAADLEAAVAAVRESDRVH